MRYLLLLAAALSLPAHGSEIDLASRIAPGKWALAYQRTGEIKPLHLKRNEEGTSYTCIGGDPRTKILNWIKSKGCTVHDERLDGGIYQMRGECELRWWKGNPIPVTVELRPENRKAFALDIQTEGNSFLRFTEHTHASNLGPCDPAREKADNPSATRVEQGRTSHTGGEETKR